MTYIPAMCLSLLAFSPGHELMVHLLLWRPSPLSMSLLLPPLVFPQTPPWIKSHLALPIAQALAFY